MLTLTKTVKFRLTLWYSLILGFFLIVFSLTVYAGLYFHLDNKVKDLLTNTVLVKLNMSGNDLNSSLYIDVPTSIWEHNVQNFVTCLPDEQQAREFDKPVCPDALNIETRNELESLSLQPVEKLNIGNESHFVSETLRFLTDFLLFTIPLIIITAFLGGYLIAESALTPLNNIMHTAKEIATGSNLAKRITLKNSSFEFEELAITFNEMMDAIEGLFQRQRDFVSEASHELQTPLAIIKTNIEVALQDTRVHNKAMLEMLHDLHDAVNRMSALVDDMLILSKIESIQDVVLYKEPLKLKEYIDKQSKQLSSLVPKGVRIVNNVSDHIVLFVDHAMWNKIFVNLFSNACKYTSEGAITFNASSKGKKSIIFSIADSGVGLTNKDKKRIFDRFYRTDKARARQTGGAGLGLSIVQQIVHAHNGIIAVESEYGAGSTFIIKLPKN